MTHMNTTDGTKALVRSRKGRMVAGICAGVADYFGWDATLIRVVVAVVSVMTGGAGVLAYLVAWALIPVEGEKPSIAEDLISKTRQGSPGSPR
jgi:phage shock protein C